MKNFIKQNKVLFLIFILSIYLMIKNSSIPYFFEPPIVISILFDAPKSAFFSAIASLVDIFTSAYVTSLIFYIFIEYVPALKQEKKAKAIMAPQLVNLYLYLNELLAMLEYSAKTVGIISDKDNFNLDNLTIKDDEIICNKHTFKNGIDAGKTPYSYHLVTDCNKYMDLISNTCSNMSSTPSLSYCNSQLIHIISKIQLSELWRLFPKKDDFLLKYNVNLTCFGLNDAYIELKSIKDDLAPYVNKRFDFEFLEISAEEIKNWKEQQLEALKGHPEIAKILIDSQQTK